ncbi:MAG: ABC transporter ATP-binding protein [Lachnospiraceae bacterium]|nr:ABC transporter ATP-binding protein [uncultured Acetatifactor sp.]MCI9573462.1 ABC transporter ATP-binding protein [Lachnospiraceae bacterium]
MKKNMKVIAGGIGLIEGLSPGFLPCCVLQACLNALSPFINIYLSAALINGLLEGWGMIRLLQGVCVMALLNLVCGGLAAWTERLVNVKQNALFAQYDWKLNSRMMELSYEEVERYEVQALRERIRQMANVNGMGLWNLVNPVKAVVRSVFTILFAIAIFCAVFVQCGPGEGLLTGFFCSAWASAGLAALILGNICVNLYTVSRSTKKVFAAFAGLVPINQVYSYYLENYIDTYHSGKDIRLYRQGDLIRSEMGKLLRDGREPMKRLKGIEFRYNGLGSLAGFAMNLTIYLTVGMRALAGLFPVGSIVQYVGGIGQFVSGFTTFAAQITLLNSNVEALELILRYLGMGEPEEKSGLIGRGGGQCGGKTVLEEPLRSADSLEIEFRNVSFTYPGTESKALDNLSFAIHPGEKLAVVGVNGSGKTTMIKLLCGLYEPDQGEILVNGRDIRELDQEACRKLFGVVFQDFQLFSFGLGQNLAGSRIYDGERARAALEEAGFGARLAGMDLETSLYKDFNPQGVEISGGEAQKIAIARALYRQAPILILDEPTAALDPQAEYEVYEKLNHISENRTAIFISHRMSSCRFCGRILVLDGGRLVQEGSHEELLRDSGGRYFALWHAQEQYYR